MLLPLSQEQVLEVVRIVEQIVDSHEKHNNVDDLIAQLNQLALREYEIADILLADETIGLYAFAEDVLTPQPVKVDDVVEQELLEIIRFLQRGEGTIREQGYWLEFLERNLPHPGISDLIYWRNDLLTPDAILAEARAYKPIML
jgi:hypothetical protein